MSTDLTDLKVVDFAAVVLLGVAAGLISYAIGLDHGEADVRFALSAKADFERGRIRVAEERIAFLEGRLTAAGLGDKIEEDTSLGVASWRSLSTSGFTSVLSAGFDAGSIVRTIRTNEKGFVICAPPWEK